ncbi:hypothetical protein Tcan_13233 [Toxocara canis]|uniref:Uncharacterized protein n=1 Tax=Toxocara canis TaxID=6265 RepID=A0A0B2W1T1_TOXCA|nr:hypothetical protein Tcan_13233 [Toxocara canis]
MNWYKYAIKALIGELGKQLYRNLSRGERERYLRCLDLIGIEADLSAGAQCTIEARNRLLNSRIIYTKWSGNNEKMKSISGSDFKNVDNLGQSFSVPASNDDSSEEQFKIDRSGDFFVTNATLKYPTKVTKRNRSREEGDDNKMITNRAHDRLGKASDAADILKLSAGAALARSRSASASFDGGNDTNNRSSGRRWLTEMHMRRRMARKRVRWQTLVNGFLRLEAQNNPTMKISARKGSYVKLSRENHSMKLMEQNVHTKMTNGKSCENLAKETFHEKLTRQNEHEKLTREQFLKPGNEVTTFDLSFNSTIACNRTRNKRSPHRLVTNMVTRNDGEIIQVTKLIRTVLSGQEPTNNWTISYNKLVELRKNMNSKRKLPGAKIYNLRLYDIVVGNNKPTKASNQNMSFPDFLTMAFELIDTLSGKTAKGGSRNGRNVKILSPRIAPLLPEKADPTEQRHLFSPSVLPLYNDDGPDTVAPLPKVLEATGLAEKDRQAILEMVMDVSGAKHAVETGLDILKKMNFFGFEAEVFEATERLTKLFLSVEKSFNKMQRKEVKRRGYTFLEAKQVEKLLNEHGVTDAKDIGFDLDNYARLNKMEREEALWKRIEHIANNKSNMPVIRDKRALPVAVLAPLVLAPYMFAPVVGISVLGPESDVRLFDQKRKISRAIRLVIFGAGTSLGRFYPNEVGIEMGESCWRRELLAVQEGSSDPTHTSSYIWRV